MRITEVDTRTVRREPAPACTAHCGVCGKKCVVRVTYGRAQGTRMSWLSVPDGWWIYVPRGTFDVKHLKVRCPDDIEVAS